MLLQLNDEGCKLARAIAYGHDIPELGKERCYHPVKRTIRAAQGYVLTRRAWLVRRPLKIDHLEVILCG